MVCGTPLIWFSISTYIDNDTAKVPMLAKIGGRVQRWTSKIWNSTHRDASPVPLNCFQAHLPSPVLSLSDSFLMLIILPVVRESVPPYWKDPDRILWNFQDVVESIFWFINCPWNLCRVVSSPVIDGLCLLVYTIIMWWKLLSIIRWEIYKLFYPFIELGSDWMFRYPISSSLSFVLRIRRFTKWASPSLVRYLWCF